MLPEAATLLNPLFLALPIVNPLGLASSYLQMTADWPDHARASMARRIAVNSLFLLVAAAFLGSLILIFFGLSLNAVSVGGGILVAAYGWRLLNCDDHTTLSTPTEPTEELISSRAFFLLTFPLTCGLGSISIAITLGASLFSDGVVFDTAALVTLIGLLIVSIAVCLCFRSATTLVGPIGKTGGMVLLRLSALASKSYSAPASKSSAAAKPC